MLAKAKTSGLDMQDVATLKFREVEASDLSKFLPKAPKAKGFVIPYFTLNGEISSFFRFRYLEDIRTPLEKVVNKKEFRYTQPKGISCGLYLPPSIDWRRIANDPKESIVITEGELKAACACKHGFPTIGLGGVSCVVSKSEASDLLKAFDDFVWADRKVVIAFDSDITDKLEVQRAENYLAVRLAHRSARPCLLRLPTATDGKKQGLDDYIVAEGPDALNKLLVNASELGAAIALHEMNEELLIVMHPPMIYNMTNGEAMSKHDFTEVAYADRTYVELVKQPDGGIKRVIKQTAKEWLKWPGRNCAARLVYRPGSKGWLNTNGRVYNGWRGWGEVTNSYVGLTLRVTLPELNPETARPGDVSLWHALLDHLMPNADLAHRQWLERWFAYPIQHPGAKLMTAVLMWSPMHGSGKSLLGETMKAVYGEDNYELLTNESLKGQFNNWAIRKQFVVGDEITGGDNRAVANKIKGMLTQTSTRINPKGLPAYSLADCINYYLTSNHADALYLEPSDRRVFVWECPSKALSQEFALKYEHWYTSEEGREALFCHLRDMDLGDFNPAAAAPVTRAKHDMVDCAKSDLILLGEALATDPGSILKFPVPGTKALWTNREVLDAVRDSHPRISENGLGRAMTVAGLKKANKGEPVSLGIGKTVRLWILFDREKLETATNKEIIKRRLAETPEGNQKY
jgi:hypothetical protein